MTRGIAAWRAVLRIGGSQLRYHRRRAALAVVGVALAVVLVVVLVGLGHGLVSTGSDAITWFEHDLWATSGPASFAPGAVGNVEAPVHDAHRISRDLERRDDVRTARPVGFQTVYVSPDGESFDTVLGVGLGGNVGDLRLARRFVGEDVHYANGSYDGPMTGRIIVDERTAARYDLATGDSLYVGGTLATARDHEFTVVGVTSSLSTFLGSPTVGMHLSELQAVSGTTGSDPASFVAVTTEPGADRRAVRAAIERQYPSLDVRTDEEQVRAVLERRGSLLASAAALALLAVAVGTVMVLDVQALLVAHQRSALAALKATGVSTRTLVGIAAVHGIALGALGTLLGAAIAVPTGMALSAAIEASFGFSNVLRTPPWVFALGVAMGFGMSAVGSLVAGWRLARLAPLDHLQR
jgi:putative ABC transport system permease protein